MVAPTDLTVSLKDKDLQDLVAGIERGEVVLPDFQRDFVWPTYQIGKLLESILNGYYINTLLTLPVVSGTDIPPPFPPRPVEGVPQDAPKSPNMEMVLDGQQRITSIYYAVTAPRDISLSNTKYSQLYCLSFRSAINGDLDEDSITWRRRDWDSSQELVENNYKLQLERDLIPFTVFKSKDTFRNWRRGMERFVEGGAEVHREGQPSVTVTPGDVDSFEDTTAVFRSYGVPIIQLDAGTSDEKVVQTFERINTQGLELGIFDILTARLWTNEIRLRDLWEDGLDRNPLVKAYAESVGEDRVRGIVLKTLALGRNEECKEKSLRQLDPRGFGDDWDKAMAKLNRALQKAKSSEEGGFGVTEKFGVPYTAMLAPLANLIHFAENEDTVPDGRALKMVHRWYWSSVFSKRYSGSSDTTSYQDWNVMRAWLSGSSSEPDSLIEARQLIPIELNLDSLMRGGLYKGVMSLIVLNRPLDFGTLEGINLYQLDDHHIFPNSKLRAGVNGNVFGDKAARHTILNRTIIEARGNRYKYRDQLPSTYLPKMINNHPNGEEGVRRLLRDHLINDEAFDAALDDEYIRFCRARKEAIETAIEDRMGVEIDWGIDKEPQEALPL